MASIFANGREVLWRFFGNKVGAGVEEAFLDCLGSGGTTDTLQVGGVLLRVDARKDAGLLLG